MGARVLVFASTLRRSRPTAPDSTRHTMNRLLNDLQIVAIDMPGALEWIATVAHELAQHALAEHDTTKEGQP